MIPFVKMHGIGNDFVLIDHIRTSYPDADWPALARQMGDRRFGVGTDGLILVEKGDQAPFRMRMFNPDGSESEMCGNGIRCFARFLASEGLWSESEAPVETGAGRLVVELLEDGQVRVDMGLARLDPKEIGMAGDHGETFVDQPIEAGGKCFRGTAVSMGNPHLVIPVPDAAAVPLEVWGSALEVHPLFPRRVNVHFVQASSRTYLIQRTWERGAGATLACGTGACASLVAASLLGLTDRKATVRLPGGELVIEYLPDGRTMMTGPAQEVFRGIWPGEASGMRPEQGSPFEARRSGPARRKSGLETPLEGRFSSERRILSFTPPRWYDTLIFLCFVVGLGLILYGVLPAHWVGWIPMLQPESASFWMLVGMAVTLAGVWALISHERLVCGLRKRTYRRWESNRLFRGSIDEFDAIVLMAEPNPGLQPNRAAYRLVLHWKAARMPLLILETRLRPLSPGQALGAGADDLLQLGSQYAHLLGVPFYDNRHIPAPCPLPVL